MRNRALIAWVGLALCAVLTGCGKPQHVSQFNGTSPAFDPVAFWTGHIQSWGVVEDRGGAPSETIQTNCIGEPEGPAGLHLRQTLTESDGTVRHRDWHLRRTAPAAYSATANDMVGTAQGTAAGRAFHWDWTWASDPGNNLKNVIMHQWMYLMPDGTMLNRTTITKLGFTVAQVTERFARVP